MSRVTQRQQQQDVACHTAAAAARCRVSHSCSSSKMPRVKQRQQRREARCTAAAAARCHVSHSCSSTAAGACGRVGGGAATWFGRWSRGSRRTCSLMLQKCNEDAGCLRCRCRGTRRSRRARIDLPPHRIQCHSSSMQFPPKYAGAATRSRLPPYPQVTRAQLCSHAQKN